MNDSCKPMNYVTSPRSTSATGGSKAEKVQGRILLTLSLM